VKRHPSQNESNEHIDASIEARLKRGTETRDEDTVTIKGATVEEATAEFEYLLEKYEAEYSDRCRNIQPRRKDSR